MVSYKRLATCYFLVLLLMFICAFRVCAIMREEKYASAAENERTRTVTLNHIRGTVFDCNMERITNANNTVYAVIFDKPAAIATLYNYFSLPQTEKIISEIKSNGFAVRTISQKTDCDGIYCFNAMVHADDSLAAKHIIGYADENGKGVCGIEQAYDSLLCGNGDNTVTFTLDGQGKILQGEEPILSYDYSAENCGVKLTIDTKIQQIAEQSAVSINCGAVVITEISTGKIRAMVSRPDYKISDLSAALKNKDEPLLNRVLCTYNIGSVFKPYVVAAGLENGMDMITDCTGYTDVDGLLFGCHNTGGHGRVDMEAAIKYSCNSFFYKYIQVVGAGRVYSLAKKAGFESSVYLAPGISSRAGSLGSVAAENMSARALANMSIGQGELLLSPLALSNIYAAIASGGSYKTPWLVEGKVKNGDIFDKETSPAEVKVMSKKTAAKLKVALASVLEKGGTGEKGRPSAVSAGGKTGTAQTGVVKNGKKVTNSWFCGFFPLENPKYTVTVLSENSAGGCSSVFAKITDAVTEYETVK